MKFDKIVLAVDLNKNSIDTLAQIKSIDFPREAEIHLVHVFEQVPSLMDLSIVFTPTEKDLAQIQLEILKKLGEIKTKFELDHRPKVYLRCLISGNPKQEFLQYIDSLGADLVIAAAKERPGFIGLFEGSFTHFLSKFCRSNLMLLRPSPDYGVYNDR